MSARTLVQGATLRRDNDALRPHGCVALCSDTPAALRGFHRGHRLVEQGAAQRFQDRLCPKPPVGDRGDAQGGGKAHVAQGYLDPINHLVEGPDLRDDHVNAGMWHYQLPRCQLRDFMVASPSWGCALVYAAS